jgi:hypothetical protein
MTAPDAADARGNGAGANDEIVLFRPDWAEEDQDPATYLPQMPELISQSRRALALMEDPEDAADAERRAALIVEYGKRADWPTAIVNQAQLLRGEALERLSVLVDEGQKRGEIAERGKPAKTSEVRTFGDLGIDKRRVAEGRKIAATGVLEIARERLKRDPDTPIAFGVLLKSELDRRARDERAAAGGVRDFPASPNSIVPLWISEANTFVARHHRHHKPDPGGLFALGLTDAEGRVIAAALCGRPKARNLDDREVVEITRMTVDPAIPPRIDRHGNEHANSACSKLYAACDRVATEMGFKRIVTYTLASESGSSLKALAHWTVEVESPGGEGWHSRPGRRTDQPTDRKNRWGRVLRS